MPKITFTIEDQVNPATGKDDVKMTVQHDVPEGHAGFTQAMLMGAAVLRMWKSGELSEAPNRLCQDIILKMNVGNDEAS